MTAPASIPPGSLILRDYQDGAIERMRAEARKGHRSICLVLPTGGGKTVVATAIVLNHLRIGRARMVTHAGPKPIVLFVAHRTELITQAAATMRRAGVGRVRTINAGRASGDDDPDVIVASVQTLSGAKWRDNLPPGVTMVVFDECHHVIASTWLAVSNAYKNAITVGLTATPERADGSPLGDVFSAIVVVASTRQLIDLGYLVPCDVYGPTEEGKALAEDPVQAYQQWGGGKRCVAFVQSVAYARALAEQFCNAGIEAVAIDGTQRAEVRDAQLAAFRRGEIRVVTNVQVLTEGWDDPGVEVCLLARKPEHSGTYLQMVGRVLRISPETEKSRAILIDLRGAYLDHGMPDDEREYALDGDAIKVGGKVEPCKQCKCCGYVAHPWRGPCPRCGNVEIVKAKTLEIDGRGVQLITSERGANESKAAYERRMRACYDGFVAEAKARGYKIGWAWHRYKQRFPNGPNFRRPKGDRPRDPVPAVVPRYDAPEQWRCGTCRATYDDSTRARWSHASALVECETCMLDGWMPTEGAAQ